MADPTTIKGRRAVIDDMVSRMTHADSVKPNFSSTEYVAGSGANVPGLDRQVSRHLFTALRAGRTPEKAAEIALNAVYGQPRQGKPPSQADTRTAARVDQLAARIRTAWAHHQGNPDRAAATATNGILDGNGLRAHLAHALDGFDGGDARTAARQAFDSYYTGGAQSFGEALVEQGQLKPRDRSAPSGRQYDDLTHIERSAVNGHLIRAGRAGEAPTSEDVDQALGAIRSR